jgi:sugar phosphate permease
MAVICYILFVVFERRGIVKYGTVKRKDSASAAPEGLTDKVGVLVHHDILRYSAVSMLTGIVRTAVLFWMPTYFNQQLGFSEKASASIFSATTLVICTAAFLAVFLYEAFGKSMKKALLLSFGASALSFILMYFSHSPVLNIILMVIGILTADSASSVMWSIYCPSLKETGAVSSATGYLDFISYFAAGVSSVLFANSVKTIGWSSLILVWAGIMVVGVISSSFIKNRRQHDIQ